MKILLGSPIFSMHFDVGLFWARALSALGNSLYLWDYRLQPEVPKVDADFSFILKGQTVNADALPHPCLNYWPDAFERSPGIEKILSHYDLVFTPVRPTPEGIVWLPSGFEPLVHRDMGLERWIKSIYIGTNNSEYKKRMVWAIEPDRIAGNGWHYPNLPVIRQRTILMPPQYLHDFVKWANQAKVLIDCHQSQGIGVNNKLLELIGCGFTIVDWASGIDELFPDIWQKFTFRTAGEARELIQYYLSHEAERNELWERQKKAIEPYSYENCAKEVIKCLESVR